MFGHISLEEVIQERMVLDGTVFPNMKGAVPCIVWLVT